jgi:hypothetical protein
MMEIWIAKPKVLLPERLQRKAEQEHRHHAWQRKAWKTLGAGLAICVFTNLGLWLVLHGYGGWSTIPAALTVIPLLWLISRAMFDVEP